MPNFFECFFKEERFHICVKMANDKSMRQLACRVNDPTTVTGTPLCPATGVSSINDGTSYHAIETARAILLVFVASCQLHHNDQFVIPELQKKQYQCNFH